MAGKSLVIGLVAEGKRDQMALEAIVLHMTSSGASVTCRRIQPRYKAVTGREMTEGGSDQVRKWCKMNPAERVKEAFFPSVLHDPNKPSCDTVIIFHDSDQLTEMNNHPRPPEPWDAKTRAKYIEDTLNLWLWPSDADRSAANRYDDHVPVVAVWALETWYVAARNKTLNTPEEVDPVPYLLVIQPDLEDPEIKGKLSKSWVDAYYENFNYDLIKSFDHVKSDCPQFKKLVHNLQNRLDHAPGAII